MFDIGWTEMLVVAIVAILFVGPKELPGMLRAFGKSIKKVRALAGDFQQQFDEALKDAELDGVKDVLNDVKNLDPTKKIKDSLNPLKTELGDVKKSLEEDIDFDGGSFFDDTKSPEISEPEFADVEAALARQKKLDAKTAKPKAKAKVKPKAVAKTKVTPKKTAAKKVAAKKPAAKAKTKKKAGA
ncbi:MAG: Sec-independent protein translocase protein TatB [Rhizobiaceae bacterium]